jgi:holliday junction DNA helicase RuvB
MYSEEYKAAQRDLINWWRKEHGETAPTEEPTKSTEPIKVELYEKQPEVRWESEIFFADDDPKDWHEYHGQDKIKEYLQLQIDVVPDDEGLKVCLICSAGGGKTSIVRIIGNKLISRRGGRYIELTPAMLETKNQIDDLLGQLKEKDLLFIDEIHMLGRGKADILLPAIEDGIHPFKGGMKKLPKNVTWIGATTDVGLLPAALKDRFQLLALAPLSKDNLKKILQDMPFPISERAADEIAYRACGSPRELKRVYKLTRDVARKHESEVIEIEHAEKAFDLLELDPDGLYVQDRAVLDALYNHPKTYASGKIRFSQSERAIRALSGIDESLFRDYIEPKLLNKGLLTIGTGGRTLTEKAIKKYFPNIWDHYDKENVMLG